MSDQWTDNPDVASDDAPEVLPESAPEASPEADLAEAVEADVEAPSATEHEDEEQAAEPELPTDEDGDVLEAVDPVKAFKDDLASKFGDWYVVHSYAGYENRVKANLENRITSLNM